MPEPTGCLFAELKSYAVTLYEPCLASANLSAICLFPVQSDWCAFTTVAPIDVPPAFVIRKPGVLVVGGDSSAVVSFTEMCPNVWANGL